MDQDTQAFNDEMYNEKEFEDIHESLLAARNFLNEEETTNPVCEDSQLCFNASNIHGSDSKNVFDLSTTEFTSDNNLSAAIKMEEEFLEFMFSLPDPEKPIKKEMEKINISGSLSNKTENDLHLANDKKCNYLNEDSKTGGLNHLDNLCRMMEQLGELREKNTKLQRRVHYLEELKTLQEMHIDLTNSLEAQNTSFSIESINLTNSDVHLKKLSPSCAYILDSEDSLDSPCQKANDGVAKIFKFPDELRSLTSSEEERTVKSGTEGASIEANKPCSKSTWGKMKNMMAYNNKQEHPNKTIDENLEKRRQESKSRLPDSVLVINNKNVNCDISRSVEAPSGCPASVGCNHESDTNEDDSGNNISIRTGPSQRIRNISDFEKSFENRSGQNRHNVSPEILRTNNSEKEHLKMTSYGDGMNRPSNWTKVKQAFLSGSMNQSASNAETRRDPRRHEHSRYEHCSSLELQDKQKKFTHHSPSVLRKTRRPKENDVSFEDDSDTDVHKNEADVHNSLTREFNKKLYDWERLKRHHRTFHDVMVDDKRGEIKERDGNCLQRGQGQAEPPLPPEFRKKLNEWDRMKANYGDKSLQSVRAADTSRSSIQKSGVHSLLYIPLQYQQVFRHQDYKIKKHGENDLPADFKKKLTEWEIRKALVGKGEQTVEQLQKMLGEDFNKKMAEWQRMKALEDGHNRGGSHSQRLKSGSDSTYESVQKADGVVAKGQKIFAKNEDASIRDRKSIFADVGISNYKYLVQTGLESDPLELRNPFYRKDYGQRSKKSKADKSDKLNQAKTDGSKLRNKELVWLKKELTKIEKEKQRLERQTEKFFEREARLSKIRDAMTQQSPEEEKKDILIKTSTGEFRFEGINPTFTRKLYEWEERRGIRPESSTFVFLDPNYVAPPDAADHHHTTFSSSPENGKIIRSRSESSLADKGYSEAICISHQSTISLNKNEAEEPSKPAENKSVSEPALIVGEANLEVSAECSADHLSDGEDMQIHWGASSKDSGDPKVVFDEGDCADVVPTVAMLRDPYAPAEITKLIDSSGSDEMLHRRNDEEYGFTIGNSLDGAVQPLTKMECENYDDVECLPREQLPDDYQCLLRENMSLFQKLKEQETLCITLQTQMGHLDSKMNNVADQHFKTLEKLRWQVNILQNSENSSSESITREKCDKESGKSGGSQKLIKQLRSRIDELEFRGDKLMAEKGELEHFFKLHKNHETQIAESLLLRMREWQNVGTDVNTQATQCQIDGSFISEVSQGIPNRTKCGVGLIAKSSTAPNTPLTKRKRRKKRELFMKSSGVCSNGDEESENSDDRRERDTKDVTKEKHKRRKKLPPKKIQKLDNLTADLLIQAKRLEGALAMRHHLQYKREKVGALPLSSNLPRKRSLRGRSSLRLSREENKGRFHRKYTKQSNTSRNWSSIEAIASPDDGRKIEDLESSRGSGTEMEGESNELIQMNAEISRMARELRKEMINVWNFRESTSPESYSSDNREELLMAKLPFSGPRNDLGGRKEEKIEKVDPQNSWIAEETRDILNNIAALEIPEEKRKRIFHSMHHDLPISDDILKSPSSSDSPYESLGQSDPYDGKNKSFHLVDENSKNDYWWKLATLKVNLSSIKSSSEGALESTAVSDGYLGESEAPSCTDVDTPSAKGSQEDVSSFSHSHDPEDKEILETHRRSPFYDAIVASDSEQEIKESHANRFNGMNERDSTHFSDEGADEKSFNNLEKKNISLISGIKELEYDMKESYLPHCSPSHIYGGSSDSLFSGEEIATAESSDVMTTRFITIKKSNTDDISAMCHSYEETQMGTHIETDIKFPLSETRLKTRRISDSQVQYDDLVKADSFNDMKFHKVSGLFSTISIAKNQNSKNTSKPIEKQDDFNDDSKIFVQTQRAIFKISPEEDVGQQRFCDSDSTFVNDMFAPENSHMGTENESFVFIKSIDEVNRFERNRHRKEDMIMASNTEMTTNFENTNKYAAHERSSSHSRGLSCLDVENNCSTNSSKHRSQHLISKNMVLEAANESSPVVKNMIELFNKRISEKQELLMNPFAITNSTENGTNFKSFADSLLGYDNRKGTTNLLHKEVPKDSLFKSNSEIFLRNNFEDISHKIQKSFSGANNNEIRSKFESSKFSGNSYIPRLQLKYPNSSPHSIKREHSFKEWTSLSEISESTLTINENSSLSQINEEDTNNLRANKIKKAKEQFLSTDISSKYGMQKQPTQKLLIKTSNSQLFPENENISNYKIMSKNGKSLNSSNSHLTSLQNFDNMFQDNELSSYRCDKNLAKEHSNSSIKLKSTGDHASLENKLDSESVSDTKEKCYANKHNKNTRGIFRFFKFPRNKEHKEQGSDNLLSGIASNIRINESKTTHELSFHLPKNENEGECSRTLPRGAHNKIITSSAVSCPSSPMPLRKSKAAQILALSKNLFKSRSPSPRKPSR